MQSDGNGSEEQLAQRQEDLKRDKEQQKALKREQRELQQMRIAAEQRAEEQARAINDSAGIMAAMPGKKEVKLLLK